MDRKTIITFVLAYVALCMVTMIFTQCANENELKIKRQTISDLIIQMQKYEDVVASKEAEIVWLGERCQYYRERAESLEAELILLQFTTQSTQTTIKGDNYIKGDK